MDKKEGYGTFTFANGNKFEVSLEQSVIVNCAVCRDANSCRLFYFQLALLHVYIVSLSVAE